LAGQANEGHRPVVWRTLARRRQRLKVALAVLIGGALGFAYCRFGLRVTSMDAQLVGTAGGAVFGFVLALAPWQLLDFFRRRWLSFRIANRRAHFADFVQRARRNAERRLARDPTDPESSTTLGVCHLLVGDAEGALPPLEGALAQADEGRSAGVSVNLGVALAECSRYEDAARHLARAAANGARAAEAALLNLGRLYALDGVHTEREAEETVAQADCALAHNNRGLYYLRSGDLARGRASLERALELDPNYGDAKSNLALAEFYEGDANAALSAAAVAAAFEPFSAKAQINLGSLLLIAGNVAAGGEALARAARLAPRSSLAQTALGVAHLQAGDVEGAASLLATATELDEANAAAWHDRALACSRREDLEGAVRAQERAVELAPDRPSTRINLGCFRWALGDFGGAVTEFKAVYEAEPDSTDAGRNLGLAMIVAGQHREAAQLFERLHEQAPADTALALGLGAARFLCALENYSPDMHPRDRQVMYTRLYHAFRLFEGALQAAGAPKRELLFNMGLYHYVRREYEQAEARLTASAKFGEDHELLFALGMVHADHAVHLRKAHEAEVGQLPPQARDKLREALQAFRRAAEMAPDEPDLLCNLGMAAYQLDEYDTCVRAFRSLAHHERSAEAYNALALVHAKRAKALQLQARIATLATDAKRASMQREARRLLSTAINCFKEAVHRDNRNPVLHSNIGLAYLFRNEEDDVRSALAHWQMMRTVGGAWGERQYEILSDLVESKEHAKAEYNDTEMAYRPVDLRRAVRCLTPVSADVIHVFDDCYHEREWQLVTDDPLIRKAVIERDRVRRLSHRQRALSL
jgi:tetratricopeptide (TPR) repeat protein